MLHKLTAPIIEYTLVCDRLLNNSMTRDVLTEGELKMMKMSVRQTEKGFSRKIACANARSTNISGAKVL